MLERQKSASDRDLLQTSGHTPAALSSRQVEEARFALREAADCKTFARSAFRLLLATTASEFASLTSQCASLAQRCIWLSSHGRKMSAELLREISRLSADVPILSSNPGIKVLSTRHVMLAPEQLLKTLFYKIYMEPWKWRHAVALLFWKGSSPRALDCALTVYRTAEQGDFSDPEIAALAALHPEIERARKRLLKLEEEKTALHSLQYFMRNLPVPALLLNWRLKVLCKNREGLNYCESWQGGARGQLLKPVLDLPSELLEACRELKTEWHKQLDTCGPTRMVRKRVVNCQSGALLRATISMLPPGSTVLGDPNFLILFQEIPARERKGVSFPPSQTVGRLANLTPREREVALLVAEGNSNQGIADRLGRCEGTVKAELHAVFRKLGVVSRTQLALVLVPEWI